MCGIVGCIAEKEALPYLLEGLKRLEYRGYDSAGVAVFSPGGEIIVRKAVGPLANLENVLRREDPLREKIGIAHTRWATHGEATVLNAHPHLSQDGEVALVHNGIIENASEIRARLSGEGVSFYGDTDSEVLANLIAVKLKEIHDPLKALSSSLKEAKGSYALAILFKCDPAGLYVTRKDSPLVVASANDGGLFVASDASALPEEATMTYFLENGEFAVLKEGKGLSFYDAYLHPLKKAEEAIERDFLDDGLGDCPDHMLKEIREQPMVFQRTLERLALGLKAYGLSEDEVREFDGVAIVGCGSAYHVGLSASYFLESLAKMPARAELASEFRYREPALSKKTLLIAISQSGETMDTLMALRYAKKIGVKTLGIVNAMGSAIARECDYLFLTPARKEVAVATTKAYSAQLLSSFALAVFLAKARGAISEEESQGYIKAFGDLPAKAGAVIEKSGEFASLAKRIYQASSLFYIGRLLDYASALEGSLKLKEISYLHSEAYAAGELKHGTIALIEEGIPVIALATSRQVANKTIANLMEVKARGARTYVISPLPREELGDGIDGILPLPESTPVIYPFLSVIAMQLIAYHVAKLRGYDVDKPRNLAKSVTVE